MPCCKQSMADAPDGPVTVLRNQQRPVAGHGDADRPAPDLGVVDDETGDEILVFAGRHPVLQADTDDLVAGSLRAIPGTVFGREGVAAVFRGKAAAVVE